MRELEKNLEEIEKDKYDLEKKQLNEVENIEKNIKLIKEEMERKNLILKEKDKVNFSLFLLILYQF